MRFAEVVLRAGAGIVGFMVGFAQCLLLMLVPGISCEIPGNDPFFASFVLGIPLAVLLAVMGWGRTMRSSLRWVALPFGALVPLAALAIFPYLGADGASAIHACSINAAPSQTAPLALWQRVWAPFQLILLAVLGLQCIRYWLPTRPEDAS